MDIVATGDFMETSQILMAMASGGSAATLAPYIPSFLDAVEGKKVPISPILLLSLLLSLFLRPPTTLQFALDPLLL